jgi:hypothetical protein
VKHAFGFGFLALVLAFLTGHVVRKNTITMTRIFNIFM